MNTAITRVSRFTWTAFLCCLALLASSSMALAAPFNPSRLPEKAHAVGHVDVDALRTTKLFSTLSPKVGKDITSDTPAPLKPIVTELTRSTRGVSFWVDSDGSGAVIVSVKDGKALETLAAKLPKRTAVTFAGKSGHRFEIDGDVVLLAIVGDSAVLSKRDDAMTRTLDVLSSKAKGLAAASLPANAKTTGVFFFAALDEKALAAASQSAASALLKANLVSLTLSAAEVKGELRATASAEVGTEEAAQQVKGVLEGLRSLLTLADDAKQFAPLVAATTIAATGKRIDVSLAMQSTKLIELVEAAQTK